MDKITQERINSAAGEAMSKQDERLHAGSKDYGRRISFLDGYEAGYIAGATAENSMAQAMAEALEALKEGAENHTILFIDKALREWKDGKGKDNEEVDFEKWKKENVAVMGESDFIVGNKRVYGKKELRRIYEHITNPQK